MRAVTIRERAVVVADHPDPSPGAGEVLVRVRAAGLNGADMIQVRGGYPPPAGIPDDIPGLEMAGEVAGLGPGARRFEEGDRVMGIVGGAGQAELVTAHERQLMAVPDVLGWEEAGGLPEVFTTAHDALFTQGALAAGERLLVSGAAGGVGTAGVQLGRAAGAIVTATVRNEDHRAAVGELGAHEVLPPEGFEEHGPFDVVLELVGGPNIPGDLRSLALNGRIVVIGTGAGTTAELDLRPLMMSRGRIMASTLRSRPLEEKALTARRLERHVLPLFQTGALRVPIAETIPLDRAPEAYDRFRAGRKLGKIVLTL